MTLIRNELANHFVRGAVASGLLSALQSSGKSQKQKRSRVLRHALQGGIAVAAGLGVANAIDQGNLRQAGLLLAGAALGIASTEKLLANVKEKK